jgi:hypothetical protein
MKEITAYKSANGKVFERQSHAMYEDYKAAMAEQIKHVCKVFNVSQHVADTFFEVVLLGKYTRDGQDQTLNPYDFARGIKKLQRLLRAAQRQYEAEEAAKIAKPQPNDDGIPF